MKEENMFSKGEESERGGMKMEKHTDSSIVRGSSIFSFFFIKDEQCKIGLLTILEAI